LAPAAINSSIDRKPQRTPTGNIPAALAVSISVLESPT